jgi:hypothetical protein
MMPKLKALLIIGFKDRYNLIVVKSNRFNTQMSAKIELHIPLP